MFLHLGDGKWGQNHKRILSELEIDFTTEDIENGSRFYELLKPGGFEGVIITTSTINHFPILKESILAGIPVFCEKPICMTKEQASILRDLESDFHPIMMSGHQLLFDKSIQAVAEENSSVYMNSIRAGAIPRTEGAVLSLAVHDVALAHYIFSVESFTCIEAQGNKHTCKITLLADDYTEKPNFRYCEIYVQSISHVRLRHLSVLSKNGKVERFCPDNWNRGDLLKNSLEHFIDCVHNRDQPVFNSLKDSCNVMDTVFKVVDRMSV